jgi:nitrate/nitrite transport system ATP-binding protein
MVANLRAGNILGYCVGEPWNLRSDSEGLGKIVASDLDIWPDHPEKVLGVSRSWADAHPKTHRALVKALLRACEQADDPTYRREKLSSLLSDRRYVGGEAEYFQQCLVGPYRYGTDRTSGAAGLVSFSGSGKNRIGKGEMTWVLAQMARWGLCPFPTDFVGAVEQTLAPDVLSDALRELDRAPSEDEGVTLVALGDVPFDAAEPREYLRSVSMSSNLRIEEHSSTSRAQEADEART